MKTAKERWNNYFNFVENNLDSFPDIKFRLVKYSKKEAAEDKKLLKQFDKFLPELVSYKCPKTSYEDFRTYIILKQLGVLDENS